MGTTGPNPNTPRVPTDPERIEVAYGKVPLRAKVGERAVLKKQRVAASVEVLSINLQVFFGIGCFKINLLQEKYSKLYFFSNIFHVISRNGPKTTPGDPKSEKMEPRGEQNGAKGRPK